MTAAIVSFLAKLLHTSSEEIVHGGKWEGHHLFLSNSIIQYLFVVTEEGPTLFNRFWSKSLGLLFVSVYKGYLL